MDAQRSVKARCGKYAEPLHHAEISGGNDFHPQRADEHHAEGDCGADSVGAAGAAFRARGNHHAQRHDGQQHHRRRNDHMHHILERAGIAAIAEREHPVSDSGNPLHPREQIYARPQQPGSLPLYADADDGRADDLARIVKGAELVPQRQRRRVGRAQVAHRLRHPVVPRIGQRREYHRRRI